ncbi:MAG: hypothetical protein IPO04_15335 [Cytophagaceae bacterium]|nr:hypothetical protein [Cytophagaceae bacterium]
MKRNQFLKQIGIGTILLPSLSSFKNEHYLSNIEVTDSYILEANQREIERLSVIYSNPISSLRRSLGFDLANYSAAYTESKTSTINHQL